MMTNSYQQHQDWMQKAIELAQKAGEAGDIPVGALILDKNGTCIAMAQNQKERTHDPTAHAEILAIRQASNVLGDWHLNHCTMYVTLEPCPMCAGGILQSRIGRLVYGADDPKTGAIRTVINLPDHPASFHQLKVLGGILEQDCRHQLQVWFQEQRVRS